MNATKWHFVPMADNSFKIGARICRDGFLEVFVFDMNSESVRDADPVCNIEMKAAEPMALAIRLALSEATGV